MMKQTWMKPMNGASPLKELRQDKGGGHASPMRPLMLEHGGKPDGNGRNRHRSGDKLRSILVTGRAYVAMSLSSMLFFIVLGVAIAWYGTNSDIGSTGMKGIAASLSSGFFGDMLEMEMPAFQSSLESESLSGKEVGAFLMRTLTDINPARPESLVASQMAGMSDNRYFLIRKGAGGDVEVGPRDHPPTYDPLAGLHEDEGEAVTSGTDEEQPATNESGEDGETGAPPDKGAVSTGESKVVFVYHSHNRESWYPELGADAKDATSKTTNITLVGKRLADKLEELGVGSMHSDTDYPTAIKDYRWELSYKYSLKTVKEALASSSDLKFMFDIHRDSQKREYTTVDINGKSYAQVYFIIGHRNPDWKENEKVAAKIHEALEKEYPGISRGIWGKTANTGNAEYNQSQSPGNVLVEIGGVENTLEESYRTADALAKAVSSIYWEAEKVSGEE